MQDVVRIGNGWNSMAGRLVKFSAIALGAAAVIKLGLLVAAMPPGDAAFAFAPGQSRAQISLDILGSRTDCFGVAQEGVGVVVQAPKGARFVSASGSYSATSEIALAPNARRLIKFAMIDEGGALSERVVDFRSWSAPKILHWDEMAGPAPNAAWISHDARSGKYTNHILDGANYRYALAAGQKSVQIALDWVPLPDASVGGAGMDFIRASVAAPGPFVADLIAPPGMLFRFRDGSKARQYRVASPSSETKALRFVLVDAYGHQSGLVVELASTVGAPAARAALRR